MTLTAGQQLSFYEVGELLGAGGMGEVYRARDTRLGRDVALKVLPEAFVEDEERLRRFEREARMLATLNHPNVAQIHGIDQVGDTCFLALELVPGETLADRIARGRLPVDEALRLVRQVAEGLAAAHEASVVHRDLKPANVRVTPDGTAKVLDFGLAKPRVTTGSGSGPAEPDSVEVTAEGLVLGTPPYMSPEQARGRPVDRRTDVWALGCLLFECLSGVRAFDGGSVPDVLAAVLKNDPPWEALPANTPRAVRGLLARCLEKDPAWRLRDAGGAALELRNVAEKRWPEAGGASVPAPRRTALLPWVLAAAAFALALFAWRGDEPATSARERTVRLDIPLGEGVGLGLSDRMMNEMAITPDGSTLAWVAEVEGRTALFLRDLASGEERRPPLGTEARGPFFSPDGRWLGYLDRFETLMKVPAAGGPIQRIGDVGSLNGRAAWLPDGRIVFARDSDDAVCWIDEDGGEVRVLCAPDGDIVGFENVVESPVGGALLVDGWTGSSIDSYTTCLLDLEDGGLRRVLEEASSPSPIGEELLVFLRGATLLAAPFDFEHGRLLGDPRVVVDGVATDEWGGSGHFALSREGTLAYGPGRRRGEERRVVLRDPGGDAEPVTPRDAFVSGVRLGLDGRRMLLWTLRYRRELWSLDLSTRVLAPIHVPDEVFGAALSPDGERVYYMHESRGVSSLRAAPVSGGASEELCDGAYVPFSVTPDGNTLILQRFGPLAAGAPKLYSLDLADADAEPVTVLEDVHLFDPALSPDGRWLAYSSVKAGRPRIYLRTFPPGTEEWLVTDGDGTDAAWAPDGADLYYLDDTRLMTIDLTLDPEAAPVEVAIGTTREVLHSLTFADASTFSVAPDGRIAMLELAEWEREPARIRVVVGWHEELRELFASPP